MIRVLIQSALLFLLPFAGYLLWRAIARRGGRIVASAPLFWLTLSGLLLAIIALMLLIGRGDLDPAGIYVPPHVDPSGRIVPGGVEPVPRAR